MQARLHVDFRARDDHGHLSGGGAAADGKIDGKERVRRHAGHGQDGAHARALRLYARVERSFDSFGERGFDLRAFGKWRARIELRRLSAAAEPSAKEITQARPAFRRVSPSELL
jgi:hypothetical protein